MSPPFLDHERLWNRNRDRSTVVAGQGMVCASEPLAAMAGLDILKAGGNCIDAAITTNAMQGLTEPFSNGIGGDLFALVWIEEEKKLLGLNASGRSPHDWNLDKALGAGLTEIPCQSPLSWTVPGCVSGWQALRDRFGSMSLDECLAPAIGYALDGFALAPIISGYFDTTTLGELDGNKRYAHESFGPVYNPGGIVPGFGEHFRNPVLASNYQAIATDGPDAFYRGQIAEGIVATSRRLGGHMEMRDLADHRADWIDPVTSNYRGWDVWELPPNGQGIAVLQMMNILENFDLASLEHNSAEHLHLLIEAKRLAFEDRARFYADPGFADIPVDWLISRDYAAQRASTINLHNAAGTFSHGEPRLGGDTVYLTAADRHGNMISLIQSIYNPWGSTICPDDCGFAMQSRGRAFSLEAGHPNRLEPHKRPFHTIIPAFLTRAGQPVMSFGVMGADFQPQGQCQVLVNMLDFGMSVQQAGDQPRITHDGGNSPWGNRPGQGVLLPEPGISDEVCAKLVEMGHRVGERNLVHGGYQAIWREDDPLRYFGGSDPRKDGAALGY